mmetsp:Transcript_15726/g.44002  ORF Transcript_15726/g.44002 Transcript_15726/m.44002 type:complete len:343 (+) Transcript_15726:242-1270(+)
MSGREAGSGHGEDEPHVQEERQWSDAGAKIAACNRNEKMIEEKEMQLRSVIQENYSRIRDVEKELQDLQMQLKLTAGPKRSVLEMLRRKIEDQNNKVVREREKVQKAKQVLDGAEESLKKEQDIKDQLCQELNLIVQQSAHAQLDKLEQLTARLEQLGSGISCGGPASTSLLALQATVTADAAAATAEASAAAAAAKPELYAAAGPKNNKSLPANESRPEASLERGAVGSSGAHSTLAPPSQDTEHKGKKTGKKPVRSKQAEAARQRHVPLPAAEPPAGGVRWVSAESSGQQQEPEWPPQRSRKLETQPERECSNPFLGPEAGRPTNPFVDSTAGPFRGFDA